MKKAVLTLAKLIAATTLLVACAQDKSKKETFTRVSGGIVSKTSPNQNQNTDNTSAQAAPAAASTASAPTVVEETTSLCRITDDAALSEEQRKQSFCEALAVTVTESGEIKITGRHSQTNIAAYIFTAEETEVDTQDKKLMIAQHEFTKENTKENDKNVLFLAFQLNNKLSEVNTDASKIDVQINNRAIESSKFELLQDTTKNEVKVRLNDVSLINNINYQVKITYQLK